MTGDICYLAARAYANGEDPITYAEQTVTIAIEANQLVNAHRHGNPGAFPGYGPDASTAALARRILGALLDAGWTPPDTEPEPEPVIPPRWPMIGEPTEESQ